MLGETPPVCGACDDQDPFCGCDAPAPVQEQPELRLLPEEGDTVEVPVGRLWLPAKVTRAAAHGPVRAGLDAIDSPTGIFSFRLVDADYICGCAWAVGDGELRRGQGVGWRWPEVRP